MKRLILFIIIIYSFVPVFSQTITGPSGLFTIPTAELSKDGTVAIGVNYLDKKFVEYSNYEHDILIGSVSVTYLPFLEITIRATRRLNIPKHENHVMDRFIALKFNVFEENKFLPAISIGVNNPISTEEGASHFNSTYLVATKNISSDFIVDNFSFTLGYGADFISAADHQFIGPFGGASIDLFLNSSKYVAISFMVEYDAERFNGGVKLKLFDHVSILAGMMGFDKFSGGLNIIFLF